jgi:hypothetical protein
MVSTVALEVVCRWEIEEDVAVAVTLGMADMIAAQVVEEAAAGVAVAVAVVVSKEARVLISIALMEEQL